MLQRASRDRSLRFALLLAPVLVFSGCTPLKWLKEKFGGSAGSCGSCADQHAGHDMGGDEIPADAEDVLASMDGKPIITVQTFTQDFDRLLEENPQLKSVLPIMPDAEFSFLNGMVSQKVVDRYVQDKGLNKSADYKKEYERMMRSVESMLNTKYFSQEHPVQVSDADVQKFYDENKDTMPDLLVSRGGVNAAGVSFKTEAEAQEFARKARGKDLAKEAELNKKKDALRDFKYVNAQSAGIDANVKNKIIGTKKFPTTEVVKATDNVYWVVTITGQEAAKHRPFEQVKAPLQQYLEKERRMEGINKEIERLRNEYKVVVNEEYFKAKKNQAQANQQLGATPAAQQQAEAGDAQAPAAARAA